MDTKKTKNNLKDIIVNNPRAQQRIEIKKIEKEIREENRDNTHQDNNKSSFGYAFFY